MANKLVGQDYVTPDMVAKVTATPETGFPYASSTVIDGGTSTFVATGAV